MRNKSLVYVGVNPIDIPALGGVFVHGDTVEGPEELMDALASRSPGDWSGDAPPKKKKTFRDDIVEKEKP